jgi:inner membrane protein
VPTILSHPAVPIAIALVGSTHVGSRLLLAGIVASVLPDLDVLAFRFGIPYSHEFGHRGASHSLLFAVVLGSIACLLASHLRASRTAAFLFVTVACASHGLLDMLTNGGHGVAYFWPLSDHRFFFPNQVIEVSTLNLRRFFGQAGVDVLLSELHWIWLPTLLLGMAGYAVRKRNARSSVKGTRLGKPDQASRVKP